MVVEPASLRPCVRADQSQILCGASMGRGNESLCFLSGSDKNSGCYGNLKFPLTCMEKSGNWHFLLSGWGYLNFVFT